MWLLVYKLVRPIMPISSGLATWIIAQSCGATFTASLAAAISMALGTIGASFYHYGGAAWMYARKSERFKFKDPEIIRLLGLLMFGISICIATIYLPKECVFICVFNTLAIAAYSAKLSSHWMTKNITMTLVCATPIIMGWQSGETTHPVIYWGLGLAFLSYFAREVIKDVQDIKANEGKRVTLPMILGTDRVLQIAGALLVIATIVSFGMMQSINNPIQIGLTIGAALIFLVTGTILLISKKAWRCEMLIQASVCLLLLALW